MKSTNSKLSKAKITIFGAGYVGFSLGVLFASRHNVHIVDINPKKVALINSNRAPIHDKKINQYLCSGEISINAYSEFDDSLKDSDFFIIATPTNFEDKSGWFDTNSIDKLVEIIHSTNKDSIIIIKSTLPIGHTDSLNKRFSTDKILFAPEFLREGSAYEDQLNPSRIIVGGNSKHARNFATLMVSVVANKNAPILFMASSEAEAVKLFSNSYLALRVSFFNELDTFSIKENINPKNIIDGLCLDERIGPYYNNPSFGYGGYCLPKDSKQLLANFGDTPQKIFSALVQSNDLRKSFLVSLIKQRNPKNIGIYRLQMKKDSDNYRDSAILDIINELQADKFKLLIYEPMIKEKEIFGISIINELKKFKSKADLILANRLDNSLEDVIDKVFSRDIFKNN
jgi:UDPglucose 6-dehydrogenase